MHEMSLADSMLSIIEQTAREQSVRRVRAVVLEIGALACVEPDAMRFCFDAVTRGTIAEGAELRIIEKSGEGWCAACAKTVRLTERYGVCPACQGTQVAVTGGDRMRVLELDVE